MKWIKIIKSTQNKYTLYGKVYDIDIDHNGHIYLYKYIFEDYNRDYRMIFHTTNAKDIVKFIKNEMDQKS